MSSFQYLTAREGVKLSAAPVELEAFKGGECVEV